jgi:hypothetical protein
MKRFSLAALFVLTALVCAAPAAAKELTKATLCGQDDECTAITDPDKLRQVPRGGATSVPAPALQPFYVMSLTIDHGGKSGPLLLYYLPLENLLAANGELPGEMVWLPIADPKGKAILREAAKGLTPFRAPSAWPRELKSYYRVIPDDQTPQSLSSPGAASSVEREAAPVAEEDEDTSVWLYAAGAIGLASLASLIYARRKLSG